LCERLRLPDKGAVLSKEKNYTEPRIKIFAKIV